MIMQPSILFLIINFVITVHVGAWTTDTSVSRRQFYSDVVSTASAAVLVAAPKSSFAGVAGDNEPRIITRMGGLLEAYQDGPRGFRIMAPSGWNKFEGEVGAYDVKWQDLVDPTENIKISSTPVKSTTESIDALGPVKDLGIKLAEKRSAKIISASDRLTEGILFYTFDFALKDGTHQILVLCVSKGKLWSLDLSAKEKRWSKREEMYKNVAGSFVPKLTVSA